MPPFPRVNWGGLVWFVVVVFTSVVSGALTALVGAKAVGIILGAMFGGLAFLFLSLDSIFICQAVLIYLVVGQLQYFAHVQKAFWIPYLIGALLFVIMPLAMMGKKAAKSKSSALSCEIALILFFAFLLSSTVVNGTGLLLAMLTISKYIFLWSFYIFIASGLVTLPTVEQFWRWLPWLVPLQLPVVVYQRFVVATNRIGTRLGGSSWDAIVGLFGGDPDHAGANGALGMFIVFGVVLAVSQWRTGAFGLWRVLFIGLTGLASIALAEVKFAILMLPVSVALLYRRELFQRPVRTLIILVFAFATAFLVLVAYQAQFTSAQTKEGRSLGAYVDTAISRQTEADVNMQTGEMGRGAAIKFWWRSHGLEAPVQFVLGHGVGAAFVGQMAVGDEARKYPFTLYRSALLVLLWDTGLLGATAFALALVLGSQAAWQTASRIERVSPPQAGILRAVSAGLLLFLLELPYNTDLMETSSIQFLVIVMLAYVATLSRMQVTAPPPPTRA